MDRSTECLGVAWFRHFPRPDAYPEVLFIGSRKSAESVLAETKLLPDAHYILTVKIQSSPRRYASREAVASMRQAKLKKRIQKKCGELFADDFIAEELKARPDYYSGADVEKRTAMLKRLDSKVERETAPAFTDECEAKRFIRVDLHAPFRSLFVDAWNAFRQTRRWEPWMSPVVPPPMGEKEKARIWANAFSNEKKPTNRIQSRVAEDEQPSLFDGIQ